MAARATPATDEARPSEELSFPGVLDDPLVRLVMASDGVRREDLERLADGLRARGTAGGVPVAAAAAPPVGLLGRIEQRARNMGAMMRHLGVPPEAAITGLGATMAGAARRCFSCREADRCGHWLATPEADPTAWQRFCPNAELFARLRH